MTIHTRIKHAASLLCLTGILGIASGALAQKAEQLYRGYGQDVMPALAAPGRHPVGVRTVSATNPGQFNLATQASADRKLTFEVWYPAAPKKNTPVAHYDNQTRTGKAFRLKGTAYRDAPTAKVSGYERFPLVVMSHGYSGYRSSMFYLGEHLAAHGYVVVGIDHTDSTNAEIDFVKAPFSGFPSTLLNRAKDQQFTLQHFGEGETFVSSIVDGQATGIIGYSMGAFGVLNTIGGCYAFTPETTGKLTGVSDQAAVQALLPMLNTCSGGKAAGSPVDSGIKAAVAMAPWGNAHQLFDKSSLGKIDIPTLIIAGDLDDISVYESIEDLFRSMSTNPAITYMLTYANARHNIAPHPAPMVARSSEFDLGHYWESAWDSEQLNIINQHFVLAMMNCYIKNIEQDCEYFDLRANSNQNLEGGTLTPPWKGFPSRYSTGMRWQQSGPRR